MKKYFLFLILLISNEFVYSQEYNDLIVDKKIDEIDTFKPNALRKEFVNLEADSLYILNSDKKPSKPKNNFNIGAFGNASIWSFQYERLFYVKPNFSFQLGLGFGINGKSHGLYSDQATDIYLTLPLNLTCNIIWGEKHFLNIGLGSTIINGNVQQHYYFYPILGYRMQRTNKNNRKFNFGPYISYPFGQEVQDISYFIPVGLYLGYSF